MSKNRRTDYENGASGHVGLIYENSSGDPYMHGRDYLLNPYLKAEIMMDGLHQMQNSEFMFGY